VVWTYGMGVVKVVLSTKGTLQGGGLWDKGRKQGGSLPVCCRSESSSVYLSFG
jgi:hypothetical protein